VTARRRLNAPKRGDTRLKEFSPADTSTYISLTPIAVLPRCNLVLADMSSLRRTPASNADRAITYGLCADSVVFARRIERELPDSPAAARRPLTSGTGLPACQRQRRAARTDVPPNPDEIPLSLIYKRALRNLTVLRRTNLQTNPVPFPDTHPKSYPSPLRRPVAKPPRSQDAQVIPIETESAPHRPPNAYPSNPEVPNEPSPISEHPLAPSILSAPG
jgi:hypothetical protein